MTRNDVHDGERSVWKGLVAGAAAGLTGALAMNFFQSGLSKLSGAGGSSSSDPTGDDDASVKTAEAISTRLADHRLTASEKKTAGPVVHYAFGAVMGALYGAAVEMAPRATIGWGTGFGAALWAGADEIAVPLLGLSGSASESPISTHLSALAAHVVYGATAESVRRAVRWAF